MVLMKRIDCKPHCELGMVMSINAATSGDKSFSAFQANAMGVRSLESSNVNTGS